MIQSIIDGITKTITTKYGTSSFSILCSNPYTERGIGNRSRRFYPIQITYSPTTDEPVAECNDVLETLFVLLKDIETEIGVLHGEKMSGENIDGKLQFSVQYSVFVTVIQETEEKMENIGVGTTTIKEMNGKAGT